MAKESTVTTMIVLNMVAMYPDDRPITLADLDTFNDDLIAWVEARGMIIGGTLQLEAESE